MAHVIDVRSSDGKLIVLGRSLVLPVSDATLATLDGGIRFNPTTAMLEICHAGGWSGIFTGTGATGVGGPTGPTGPASTVTGPTGPVSTVAGPTGPIGPMGSLQVAFVIPNKPTAGQVYNFVVVTPLTVLANLVGTFVYASIPATDDAVFILNKISEGTTTPVASVTMTSDSNTSCVLSTQAAISFIAGEVMQLVAPVQDASLSDVGISILAERD